MPRKQSSKPKTIPLIKEKSSQKTTRPARNVIFKASIRQKSCRIDFANSIGTKESAVTQNDGTKQKSRAVIQFVAAMNYLIFFFGFCVCRHEPFARFHHNQALWMWIIVSILYLAFAFIPTVNKIAIPFVIMLHIIWMFAGVGTALKGRAYHIPLVGKIKIIDWEKV